MSTNITKLQCIIAAALLFTSQWCFANLEDCSDIKLGGGDSSKELDPVVIEKFKNQLIRCAESGHEVSMLFLIASYTEGHPELNIEKDHNKLLKLLETDARRGNSDAQDILVQLYTDDEFLKLTNESQESARYKAYMWYYASLASNQNSVRKFKAITLLEEQMSPEQVNRAIVEASDIHLANFQRNGAKVYHQLGRKYFEGKVVKKDLEKAHDNFLKAAKHGYSYSQNTLGKHYTQGTGYVAIDVSEGMRWYEKSAEQGNSYAMFELGKLHLHGSHVDQNIPRAIQYIATAAEKGVDDAKVLLGEFYVNGTHVEKDVKRAFQLFESAAKARHAQAQYYLGHSYKLGMAVQKDIQEAYKWYLKSAKAGYAAAQYSMGVVKQKGNTEANIAIARVEALEWYSKAAEQGHARARFNLGVIYAEGGGGVEKDLFKAYKEVLLSGVEHTYKEPVLQSITQQMSQAELEKVGVLLESL
ncbi:sel1 repeat family protein [Alteromonas sediminis]|uniref:Sel1 repeat family protein n=1 Tax=Alteromonas sediminis TaxID=2259342 RepID=A0A3N5ZAS9_9ALTE|nr:tetratricopeptide repeat protein [Alteromonas sediminis]RPJ68254.1 sel1 repeat family protein [Alteromonas sediminis]